jgi:hypothetical protein
VHNHGVCASQVFEQYSDLLEAAITDHLTAAVEGFDLMELVGMLNARKDELDGEVFDMMLTLTDFEAFKELMLAYQAQVGSPPYSDAKVANRKRVRVWHGAKEKPWTILLGGVVSSARAGLGCIIVSAQGAHVVHAQLRGARRLLRRHLLRRVDVRQPPLRLHLRERERERALSSGGKQSTLVRRAMGKYCLHVYCSGALLTLSRHPLIPLPPVGGKLVGRRGVGPMPQLTQHQHTHLLGEPLHLVGAVAQRVLQLAAAQLPLRLPRTQPCS